MTGQASTGRGPLRPLREVLAAPTWPGTVERPPAERRLGAGYDTAWSRTPAARFGRALVLDNLTRPALRLLAAPHVSGLERLEALYGPVVFAANHSSHLDTALVLAALPVRFRHRCVVAAAADYFFDRHWKAVASSLALATIPFERGRVSRQGTDLAAELLDQGWSVVIFDEGGRSPDGWGQRFRGGAAYLAKRAAVPVVPVHLHGVRPMLPKGGNRLRPGSVDVRFGTPLRPLEAAQAGARPEDARRFAARIEEAVAVLADEAATDWWQARRRAAEGVTPDVRGPASSPWRRAWDLPEHARTDVRRRRLGRAAPW